MLMFHLLYEFRVASGFVLETVSNSRVEIKTNWKTE